MTRADAEAAISEAAKDALKHKFDILRTSDNLADAAVKFAVGCDEIIAAEALARKIIAATFK